MLLVINYKFLNFGLFVVDGFMQRGDQTVSKISLGIVSVVWFTAGVCFFIALPSHSWLWLISVFKYDYPHFFKYLSASILGCKKS